MLRTHNAEETEYYIMTDVNLAFSRSTRIYNHAADQRQAVSDFVRNFRVMQYIINDTLGIY